MVTMIAVGEVKVMKYDILFFFSVSFFRSVYGRLSDGLIIYPHPSLYCSGTCITHDNILPNSEPFHACIVITVSVHRNRTHSPFTHSVSLAKRTEYTLAAQITHQRLPTRPPS
jgi:hypothetical protein